MSDTLIKVEGVSKKYCRSLKKSLWYGMQDLGREITGQRHGGNGELRPDEFWAVKDVSFELKEGECLGLIGHNGAGKTTLLRMLNGLVKPDGGRIEMKGKIGALIALGAGFNPILTGRENIYVNAAVLGLTKKETDAKFNQIVEFADIGDFIDAPVQTYSSGMAVRLGFAIAANTEPDILLLDEVLAVGDIAFQAKCMNTLADFRKRGVASILVSHNMHHISRYASQVLYLKKGKIEFSGMPEKAIDRFMSDMSKEAEDAAENTDWLKTYGSGKVIMTGSRFRNKANDVVSEIEVGEFVALEIDYKCLAVLESPPVLDLIIRSRGEVVFQGRNDTDGKIFMNFGNHSCMRVAFNNFPLNENHVEFFFSLLDANTFEVLDWKRHIRLNIRRRSLNTGLLYLWTDWSNF